MDDRGHPLVGARPLRDGDDVPEGRVAYVRADLYSQLLGLVLKADQGDWDRTVPTLAQYAEACLRELCTCSAYELNFSTNGPPPHREGCPAAPPPTGVQ